MRLKTCSCLLVFVFSLCGISSKCDALRISSENVAKARLAGIKVLTYNVNEKSPPNNLEDLLSFKGDSSEPDIFAIGLQEVNPAKNPFSKQNEKLWIERISNHLSDLGYVELRHKGIHGSVVIVFVKQTQVKSVSGVEDRGIRLGVAKLYGNKGATAIRFDYNGISICFVNSHLAAHEEELQKRIENFQDIEKGIIFNNPATKTILQHDLVFWFGDLNFRIENLSQEKVLSVIHSREDIKPLLENDQLRQVMKNGKAFSGYTENKPEFYPTFKFFVDSNDYNPKRKPAFTDRILYRVRPVSAKKVAVEQMSYLSKPNFLISDHKPVLGEFQVYSPTLFLK